MDKSYLEGFIHNNMPREEMDPDDIFADAESYLPADYVPSPQHRKAMDRMIQSFRRRQRWKDFWAAATKGWIPKLALASVLVVCFGAVVVQANNGLLFDFLLQTNQTYTGIQLTEQVKGQQLADVFEKAGMPVYFPKYLPKGYEIVETKVEKDYILFDLEKDGKLITIVQTLLKNYETKFQIDSEGDIFETVSVNGTTAYFTIKENSSHLYFFDNSYSYIIIGTELSEKDSIRIAESFELVA